MTVTGVELAHSAEWDAATLAAARRLMEDAFHDRLSDDDWEHALGGVYALVREGDRLVAHGSVVQRRLLHNGRALRTGYVEAVAVRTDRRRRGYGAALMDALERVIGAAYDLGALSASEDGIGFYAARGWQRWRGPTSVLAPTGITRTPDEDDSVFVVPGAVPLSLRRAEPRLARRRRMVGRSPASGAALDRAGRVSTERVAPRPYGSGLDRAGRVWAERVAQEQSLAAL